MELTRLDPNEVEQRVARAESLLRQIGAELDPILPLISKADREAIPRARSGLFAAIPKLTSAVHDFPQLAEVSGFDETAVYEDKRNVETVSRLLQPVAELSQRLNDAVLVWTGEIVVQSSTAYNVSKALVKKLPNLRVVVDSLAPVFALPSRRKTSNQPK